MPWFKNGIQQILDMVITLLNLKSPCSMQSLQNWILALAYFNELYNNTSG